MQLSRRDVSYIYVLVILFIGGFFSYLSFTLSDVNLTRLVSDSNFRQLVFVFVITSLVTIYGLDFIFKRQRNSAVVETLRLLGIGYDTHGIFATATNFLVNSGIINYTAIDPIFHNYHQTKRGDCEIPEARRRVARAFNKHISFFQAHEIDVDKLGTTPIDFKDAERMLDTYRRYLAEINSKFSYSLKLQSPKLKTLYILHEMLKNNIWTFSRYLDDPTSSAKRLRVYISTYRLIYSMLPLLTKERGIFFNSEAEYELEMTGRYYGKIKDIRYFQPKTPNNSAGCQ